MQSAANGSAGYAGTQPTKPPNWHGLIAWDMLFNALATGLFLAAALCEFAAPNVIASIARVVYPVALLLLVADLGCLVIDLGDPSRFHHMLRVFKPSSPMSLGTWSLTVFSLPLAALVANDWLIAPFTPDWLHALLVALAVVPAVLSMSYKGVLFSTSAQPGWRDARWLGAFHTSSAFGLGCAGLLVVTLLFADERAATILRAATALSLFLSLLPMTLLWVNLRSPLAGRCAIASPAFAIGLFALGVILPLILLGVGGWFLLLLAGLLILFANLLMRGALVMIPHELINLRS